MGKVISSIVFVCIALLTIGLNIINALALTSKGAENRPLFDLLVAGTISSGVLLILGLYLLYLATCTNIECN